MKEKWKVDGVGYFVGNIENYRRETAAFCEDDIAQSLHLLRVQPPKRIRKARIFRNLKGPSQHEFKDIFSNKHMLLKVSEYNRVPTVSLL